ncbi:uncharacterized protein LOC119610521 [Lucilia sericata]|uniref:uncharacterized protein LOC119610521 n=1 Tax=Lucilia sericata TaxID=13632 RepID=UPI0018A85EBE|nr:uncharacterized protein LOC119610521 [Lucilia sericata]
MDKDQFAAFMQMQHNLVTQVMQMAAQGQNTVQGAANTSATTTALLPNFEPFDSSKESFRNYIQRFKNYTEMKAISTNNEYCAKLLLNSIGAKLFNMVSALAAPKALNEVQYGELLQLLETHLSPKKNVLVTQHQFLSKYQSEGQSIAEFVAALRAEIGDCEFVSACKCKASVADIFLRAQFIRGIYDNNMREQLLQSGSSQFEDVVAKAIAIEAAKADSKEMTMRSSTTTTINQVSKRKNHKYNNKAGQSSKTQQPQGKIDYKKLGIDGLCLRCGRSNHFAKDCHTDKDKLKCTGCNKKGHIVKVCIATLSKSSNGRTPQKNYSTNQIHQDEDYGVYKVIDVYQNNNNSTNAERYYTDIDIEGKMVKFEVDSGSGFTFLPRGQFNKLQLDTPVVPTNIAFRSYTQTTFIPDGKIKVKARYNNSTIFDDIYIVPDGCSALVGRSWIRRLNINLNDLDNNSKTTNTADINQVSVIDEIIHEFSEVFQEKIGCTRQYKVSLQLREGVKPIYNKERQIPYSLTERVEKELDVLEQAGIISKTTNSDWGSPLVPTIPENNNEKVVLRDENNKRQYANIEDLVEIPNDSTNTSERNSQQPTQQESSSNQQESSSDQQTSSSNQQASSDQQASSSSNQRASSSNQQTSSSSNQRPFSLNVQPPSTIPRRVSARVRRLPPHLGDYIVDSE